MVSKSNKITFNDKRKISIQQKLFITEAKTLHDSRTPNTNIKRDRKVNTILYYKFFSNLLILLAIVVGSIFNFLEAIINLEHLESVRKEFKSFQLNIILIVNINFINEMLFCIFIIQNFLLECKILIVLSNYE